MVALAQRVALTRGTSTRRCLALPLPMPSSAYG